MFGVLPDANRLFVCHKRRHVNHWKSRGDPTWHMSLHRLLPVSGPALCAANHSLETPLDFFTEVFESLFPDIAAGLFASFEAMAMHLFELCKHTSAVILPELGHGLMGLLSNSGAKLPIGNECSHPARCAVGVGIRPTSLRGFCAKLISGMS